MLIDIALSILFQPACFLFKWIRSFQHQQDQLSFLLNGVCFIRPKLPLFSHPPTLFLRGPRFLFQLSILSMEVSPFFSFTFLHGGSLEDALLVRHSSFFSSSMNSIQAFGVDHILSSFQKFYHTGAPRNHPLLAIQLFRTAQDISKIRVSTLLLFHSTSAFSLLNRSTVYLLSGP